MFKKTVTELCKNSENIAAKRISYLLNKIDFNSINTILDIGSWHLKQTIEMAIIFPNANIHAFEPNPETYELCLRARDSLPEQMKERIRIHKIALSDRIGKVNFYPLDKTKTNSSNEGIASLSPLNKNMDGSLLGDKWVQKKIIVDSCTLDEWSRMNNIEIIDFIWMDVQGAELRVLTGAESVLKNVKAVCTEAGIVPYYENHGLKSEIDSYFAKNNFIELEEAFLRTTWSSDKAAEADVIYLNKKFVIK
jgi:FkbM family methyltransferase